MIDPIFENFDLFLSICLRIFLCDKFLKKLWNQFLRSLIVNLMLNFEIFYEIWKNFLNYYPPYWIRNLQFLKSDIKFIISLKNP